MIFTRFNQLIIRVLHIFFITLYLPQLKFYDMCKSPNGNEFTINLHQRQPRYDTQADLSSLYSPNCIQIEQVDHSDDTYSLYARCSLPFGECPYCGTTSHRVHSRYMRTLSDLSILGHRVIITFESGKFFCDNPECHKKTFAEQPGDEIFRYRRRPRRCEMLVTQNGLECSSETARKLLHAAGRNINQIARELDIARQTVRKYMKWESLPKRASKERNPYYLYDTYVEEEYRHGKDLRKIFLDIKAKGFQGAITPFYDHYRYLSDGHRGFRSKADVEKMKYTVVAKREPLLPIRQIAGIVDKSIRQKKMTPEESALVERMQGYGWFRDIYGAASSFYTTIMGDDTGLLGSWLESYGSSPISELRSFAYGIRMDIRAVNNAIELDTSNGIVEGYVNKVKVVKRVMYGRASVELLRRKMVFSKLGFN